MHILQALKSAEPSGFARLEYGIRELWYSYSLKGEMKDKHLEDYLFWKKKEEDKWSLWIWWQRTNSFFLISVLPLLFGTPEAKKRRHQRWLEEKILSFDCLIDCLLSPWHAQQPMLGTSLWDNRLKQVLYQGRQSRAGDVIRGDLRASDLAESASLESWCGICSFTKILSHHPL